MKKNDKKKETVELAPSETFAEKDNTSNYPMSKFDFELYDAGSDKKFPILRVKYIKTINKVEKWKVIQDDKTLWVIESIKLTKKERTFLKSPQGVSFLLAQIKKEILSYGKLKKEIKKLIAS